MKKRIDWDQYVPLGISGTETRNNLIAALAAASLWSLGFLFRFSDAKQELFFRNGKLTGLPIAPFREVIGNAWLFFGILALGMVITAGYFYVYHYQDGRSIYTMKRLPNGWELWRRCLTMPFWTVVVSGILILLLTGIYYLIYLKCTPVGCLP